MASPAMADASDAGQHQRRTHTGDAQDQPDSAQTRQRTPESNLPLLDPKRNPRDQRQQAEHGKIEQAFEQCRIQRGNRWHSQRHVEGPRCQKYRTDGQAQRQQQHADGPYHGARPVVAKRVRVPAAIPDLRMTAARATPASAAVQMLDWIAIRFNRIKIHTGWRIQQLRSRVVCAASSGSNLGRSIMKLSLLRTYQPAPWVRPIRFIAGVSR